MKLKFAYSLAATIALTAAAVFAQATGGSSALPAAPGTPNDPPVVAGGTGSKLAAINVEGAIFATNEGQRDMDTLQKKFEPKSNELKGKNDEIEALKKQSTATGVADEKKAELQRQVDQKQKALERDANDAREDFQTQQNEIGQRILQKMAPVIMKYANDNGLGIIIDTSNQWPQGQVLWASQSVDITKAIVDAYNAQSGVAPPPKTGGAKPSGLGTTKPSTTKPATTPGATSKPATSTTPPTK